MARTITIVLTQGDPAGIGPELAARAASEWARPADCRLVVLGFERQAPLGNGHRYEPIPEAEEDVIAPGVAAWSPSDGSLDRPVRMGESSELGARAALRCIERAADLALAGRADAICTGPINKSAIALAGCDFPGHTELLAARAGAGDFAMMLQIPRLRVVLATIHEPLRRVPDLIETGRLVRLFELTAASMPEFGIETPRIGVAGLNPHAGEGGSIGREEIEIIAPAIEEARSQGLNIEGPLAADTLFHRALEGEFDVTVAMYHDQGLIPIKTLDFHRGVNITLGLPFVRTSPDHGTAYDIAGRGVARPGSLFAALDAAHALASRRRALTAIP